MLVRLGILVGLASALGCSSAYGMRSDQALDPSREPAQSDEPSTTPELAISAKHWHLTPLARYSITARVLHRERYYFDQNSDLSPLDLALGWGYLANPDVDRFIDWYQSSRWYFYHYSASSPFGPTEISAQSANVHIVPANANLERALLQVAPDQLLALHGHLIRAQRDNDPEAVWQSSLSRTDTGGGSCELMYVERLVTGGLDYQ